MCLREIGLRVTVYVDDFLLGASDKHIVDARDQLLHTLEDLDVIYSDVPSGVFKSPRFVAI